MKWNLSQEFVGKKALHELHPKVQTDDFPGALLHLLITRLPFQPRLTFECDSLSYSDQLVTQIMVEAENHKIRISLLLDNYEVIYRNDMPQTKDEEQPLLYLHRGCNAGITTHHFTFRQNHNAAHLHIIHQPKIKEYRPPLLLPL